MVYRRYRFLLTGWSPTVPFWSSLHLIAESRAMLHVGSYPASLARLDQASQHLIGVRFDLR